MFRHLIVPLDGSEFAAHTLPVGRQLAAAAGASVRVLGVARTDAELRVDVRPRRLRRTTRWGRRGGRRGARRSRSHRPARRHRRRRAQRPLPCVAPTDQAGSGLAALRRVTRDPPIAASCVAVGPNASTAWVGSDVVVALDGVSDAQPLLDVGASWARQLGSSLRLVTVYEPVLAEVGDPTLFVRQWGTSYDPDVYLEAMTERVDDAVSLASKRSLSRTCSVRLPD